MVKQKVWALGWMSKNNEPFPPIETEGIWRIFFSRYHAERDRQDEKQDLRHVEITVEVIKRDAAAEGGKT